MEQQSCLIEVAFLFGTKIKQPQYDSLGLVKAVFTFGTENDEQQVKNCRKESISRGYDSSSKDYDSISRDYGSILRDYDSIAREY